MEKEKNVEEGMGSNDQDASSASSVNGESSNNGKKRSRDDEIEVPVPRKKVKIVWTNSLHNRFLQAINHLGLESKLFFFFFTSKFLCLNSIQVFIIS